MALDCILKSEHKPAERNVYLSDVVLSKFTTAPYFILSKLLKDMPLFSDVIGSTLDFEFLIVSICRDST